MLRLAGALVAILAVCGSCEEALAARDCSAAIERFQAILNQDIKMGRVDRPVYDQAMRELASAAASCRAGRNAAALAAVKASERRHGYPSSL